LSAQFNRGDTRVVTASADNTARLWDARTGRKIGEPMTHQGRVLSAQFNRDGTQVVTASEDGTVRLWDARTGKPLGVTMMHQDRVLSARFSPDGRQVVTASADKTARLWEVPTMISDNQHLLAQLAETIAGNRLNDLGAVETLKDQKKQLGELCRQTANAPLGEPTAESFIRWFLSDPWTRTVSPFSKLTVPEYIQQQIAAGHRDQMKQEFPGHPLLRSPAVSNQPLTPALSAKSACH
jgi:hypothetical protein